MFSIVIGCLSNLLPLIWFFVAKKLPGIGAMIAGAAGRAGVLGKICAGLMAVYWFVRRLPISFLKIKLGSGVLGKIFTGVRWILNMGFKFPVIMFITLVLSQVFPSLLEKIFMLIGAVAIKISVMLFGKIMSAMEDSNNMDMINSIVGDSLDAMPPCLIDVLGYMHIVEDLGMIISTLVLIMTYNLVSAIAFKFVR